MRSAGKFSLSRSYKNRKLRYVSQKSKRSGRFVIAEKSPSAPEKKSLPRLKKSCFQLSALYQNSYGKSTSFLCGREGCFCFNGGLLLRATDDRPLQTGWRFTHAEILAKADGGFRFPRKGWAYMNREMRAPRRKRAIFLFFRQKMGRKTPPFSLFRERKGGNG